MTMRDTSEAEGAASAWRRSVPGYGVSGAQPVAATKLRPVATVTLLRPAPLLA